MLCSRPTDSISLRICMIDISISVRPDGTIGEIHATWGGESSWSYRLTYSDLGSTAPLEKPAKVQSCLRCSLTE